MFFVSVYNLFKGSFKKVSNDLNMLYLNSTSFDKLVTDALCFNQNKTVIQLDWHNTFRLSAN